MTKPQLSVRGLGKSFGGLVALHDVSFEVAAGQIVGVMGANGAGKTTLFSLIAGNTRPTAGEVHFEGRPITGLRADQICRLGIARTFQIVKPFPMLTVLENLRTAAMFGKARIHDPHEADAVSRSVLQEVGLAPWNTSLRRPSPCPARSAWRSHARWRRAQGSSCWTRSWRA
jgi:branched-chain amino acid transport system ATP-binding protein